MAVTELNSPAINRRLWPYRLFIVAALLLALFRLLGSDFTWWDDQLTIHQNPRLNPPTLSSLADYWREPTLGLYVPVTYTMWAAIAKVAYVQYPVDEAIFLNPWFFHSVNVLLHLLSTLLVFGILRRLTGRIDLGLIGALFFGLHPVQVETIGWVSGGKDLLCWMFALWVVRLYARRVCEIQTSGRRLWASWEMPACCVLLALGILSKPTSMVTPAALLMIDALLLRRAWLRPLMELLPLFAISAGGAVIARVAQYVTTVRPAPIWQRPFIVGDNTLFYLCKIIWPQHLAIDYSRNVRNVTADPALYWHWTIPAVIALVILLRYRKWPALVCGAAIFLIGYAPVSGFATFQMQNISFVTDHYLYFSLFGVALAVTHLLRSLPRPAMYAIATLGLALMGYRSYVQTDAWRNTKSLYEITIAANPNSGVIRNNLAASYMSEIVPRYDLAETLLEEAIALNPDLNLSYANLGRVKAVFGKKQDAIRNFDIAWKLLKDMNASNGERAALAYAIAGSMGQLDDLDAALKWVNTAHELNPGDYAIKQMLAHFKAQATTRSSDASTKSAEPTTDPALPPESAPSR